MTVPTLQAIGTAVSGTTGITVSWPSHQSGDIGLLIVEGNHLSSTLSISGWTHVGNSPVGTAVSFGTTLQILWKRASSDSESSVTVPDNGDHQYGLIITVRGGLSSGVPYHITASTESSSTYPSFPGFRTEVNDCLLLFIVSKASDSSSAFASSWSSGSLSTITEQFDAGTLDGDGGGIAIASSSLATAGLAAGVNFTSSSSANHSLMTLAFSDSRPSIPFGRMLASEFYDGTSGSVTSPAFTPDAGSVILAHVSYENEAASRTFNTPSGFTALSSAYSFSETGNYFGDAWFWKISDGSTETITATISSGLPMIVVHELVNGGTPSVKEELKSTGSTGTISYNATSVAGKLIVSAGRGIGPDAVAISSWTSRGNSTTYRTLYLLDVSGDFAIWDGYYPSTSTDTVWTDTVTNMTRWGTFTFVFDWQSTGGGLFWAGDF